MDSRRLAESFKSAEAHGFLPVPIPVPPMIESAFRYRGHSQYVCLGFGAQGGTMGDMVRDSVPTEPPDLYRQFLLHPAVMPYTGAFQIDTDAPEWVRGKIVDSDEALARLESWLHRSRCLLLDRQNRKLYVSTLSDVRNWLMFRIEAKPFRNGRRFTPSAAVRELFSWLDAQPLPTIDEHYLRDWNAIFNKQRAIEACVGAAFELGFKGDEVRRMVSDVLRDPGRTGEGR
jgi:hypothetical protein